MDSEEYIEDPDMSEPDSDEDSSIGVITRQKGVVAKQALAVKQRLENCLSQNGYGIIKKKAIFFI